MAKEFIVAIELGSSKIRGIAGKKNVDGSISVLEIVSEDSTSCIRNGVVYNLDKTKQALLNVKNRLEVQLGTHIRQVYVGVGGQSIRGIKNVICKDLPEETVVTQEMVNELMDGNRNMSYPDQWILDAITQEYKVGSQYALDPVGIQCQRIEGNFLNILWRKSFYKSLNRCLEDAGIAIAEMYLSPLALADSVLAEAEKRAGCVLVDLGASTTTVSVYYKNILRHLAVIPLGGANITRDIASQQMEESDAEELKLKYGCAYTESADIDATQRIPIDAEREIEARKFHEIVEGRMLEIIENVWYQVPSEYADKLLGGFILTGGGANMKKIETAFAKHTRIEKIRIAKSINQTYDASQPEIKAQNCMMNTVLGILAKGDMNCAGDDLSKSLFGSEGDSVTVTTADLHRVPRSLSETQGRGVVQTEAELQKAAEEEERRRQEEEQKRLEEERKREEEERLRREEEEKKRQEEERIRRENSFGHKVTKGMKSFFLSMFTADSED